MTVLMLDELQFLLYSVNFELSYVQVLYMNALEKFIKGKFLLLYRMDSRDPELTVLSQTSDHLTIQSQSETVAWGDSWTSGEEPDLARSLLSLYCVRLYRCQIPTSKVSNYTPVQ